MQMKLYNFLVNKHAGIRYRYHQMHDGAHGGKKVLSWLYLLYLNFCYHVLFCRFLDLPEAAQVYEEKKLLLDRSESETAHAQIPDVDRFAEQLAKYDVVSFDIFDTLIFRPFSEPTDVFYFVGEKLGLLDFKRIRMEQELAARKDCYGEKGHYEVTFADIWNRMEQETGISAVVGMETEQEAEQAFCYANPFMLEVFQKLREWNKEIIVISDMYLPKDFLWKLLEDSGYIGISKLYVSCEYGKNKGTGDLFELVKAEMGESVSMVHVGDNEHSDVQMAKRHGFASMYYPNVNKMAFSYRAYDMSPVIGGAYRGTVDNHLYQGLQAYSMEYEYGFVYGGLFVVGYCSFIHRYCKANGIDKILFLSRDGDILKQVYDRLYPEDDTVYAYWSRAAGTKLMAAYHREDYFRRYLHHKVNQKISMEQILCSMELDKLADKLSLSDELTDKNVDIWKRFLQQHFDEIIEIYQEQDVAANAYYTDILFGAKRAAAVDIGWAGSGAMSLSYLVERIWKLPCEITGIIAGTNTVHNAEPDASEIFLQSGKLVSYLFSQSNNRDVMKRHDLNKDYNVYWELLLSSTTKQFRGFGFEDGEEEDQGKIKLYFGKEDANQEGIREIQKGILDFAEEYRKHFKDLPYMFHISGRDAYAPMLLAASHNEKYLKQIAKRFALEVNIG